MILIFASCNREYKLKHKRVFVLDNENVLQVNFFSHQILKDSSYLETIFKMNDLVNILDVDSTLKIDLRYSSIKNIFNKNIYDGLRNAYLHCNAAVKLSSAQYYLKKENPNYSLLVLDAARPLHVQQIMWDSLKIPDENKHNYLSPTHLTSLHNYGCAVDVTILNLKTNQVLDMGTDFDFFGDLAQPKREQEFLANGKLSKQVIENRKLLRKAMISAGFRKIGSEWWHFNSCRKEDAINNYKLIK